MQFQRRFSKIFFIYVLKAFFTIMTCCLGGFITLFVVVQLFDILPDFLDSKVSVRYLIEYFMLTTPQQLLFAVLPISVLLSASFMVIGMTVKHEITALRSAGVSLFNYFMPVWLVSLLLSLGTLVLNYYPLATSWMQEGREIVELLENPEELINRSSQAAPLTFNNNRDSSRQWVFGAYREKGLKEKVSVTQYYSKENYPTEIEWSLQAEASEYFDDSRTWEFYDGRLYDLSSEDLWTEDLTANFEKAGLLQKKVCGVWQKYNGHRIFYFADGFSPVEEGGNMSLVNARIEEYDQNGKRLSSEEYPLYSGDNFLDGFSDGLYDLSLPAAKCQRVFNNQTIIQVGKIKEINYLQLTLKMEKLFRICLKDGKCRFDMRDEYTHQMGCVLKYYNLSSMQKEDDFPLLQQECAILWAPYLTYRIDGAKSHWVYKKGLEIKQGNPTESYQPQDGTLDLFLTRPYANERIFDERPTHLYNTTADKEELCIRELRQMVRRVGTLPEQLRREYEITIWNRIFTSFMPLIAALVGISLSLIRERANPVAGFAKATAVMLSFYAIDQMFVLSGMHGFLPLPAFFVGGAATILFLIFGYVMMRKRQ